MSSQQLTSNKNHQAVLQLSQSKNSSARPSAPQCVFSSPHHLGFTHKCGSSPTAGGPGSFPPEEKKRKPTGKNPTTRQGSTGQGAKLKSLGAAGRSQVDLFCSLGHRSVSLTSLIVIFWEWLGFLWSSRFIL